MNRNLIFIGTAAFVCAAWAKPTITPQAPVYDKARHMLTVTYALSEPAVVTVRVSTNSVAIPFKNVRHLGGDVNRLVTNATGVVRWRPEGDFPSGAFDAGKLGVELVAWSRDLPPDYMVVDLVAKNCVRYYETTNDVPGVMGY